MIHFSIRAVQVACALAVTFVGWWSGHREVQTVDRPVEFSVAIVGECERDDGSWEGVDVLADPSARVDRIQLQVRSGSTAALQVDVLEAIGEHQVYPVDAEQAPLGRRVTRVLPSATGFYRVSGDARLRLRLTRAGEARVESAVATGKEAMTEAQLSDGAPVAVTQRVFRSRVGAELELAVAGRVATSRE